MSKFIFVATFFFSLSIFTACGNGGKAIDVIDRATASEMATTGAFPEFDRGPDPADPMQMELVEILQDMPYLPGVSEKLNVLVPNGKGQKMRPEFGAMPFRGFLAPNSISVLVIGQDGTHIAEGANRPGIAGFGGRVQDMLLHFGIYEGVAFTNLYLNTIKGQYGSRSTPVVVDGKKIQYQNVIENRQWLLTHDGLYAKWRNRFLGWIIRNNTQSLRMVMMLGQAGKDAGSSFVNSIGGSVTARAGLKAEILDVPVFKMVGAGGNNEFAVAMNAEGKDIAEILRQDPNKRAKILPGLQQELAEVQPALAAAQKAYDADPSRKNERRLERAQAAVDVWQGRIKALNKGLNYKDGNRITNEGCSTYVAEQLMMNFPADAIQNMVISNGGPAGNGVLVPQQFGGWDLRTMTVNGQKTRSIKGLKIPCLGSKVGVCAGTDSVVAPDIVFVGSPHPTALSMSEQTNPGSAAVSVEKELLAPLKQEQARGWIPPQPEKGMRSAFLQDPNAKYKYGRGVIPPSHGDPGITAMRLLPVSTAQRGFDNDNIIIIGTRDGVALDNNRVDEIQNDVPSNQTLMNSHNVLTGRARFTDWVRSYDRGPSKRFSDLLFKSLKKEDVFLPKQEFLGEFQAIYKQGLAKAKDQDERDEAFLKATNKIFEKEGIDAFNIKSHAEGGFFGHYRGTFENPQVVILADPHGYDSFITSKAATGARGQYLNGLMQDIRVGDQYLVLSTVPVMMDGARNDEWNEVLDVTQDYRRNLLAAVMQMQPKLLIADGKYAAQELTKLGYKNFITIEQSLKDPSLGIQEAGAKIVATGKFSGSITGNRIDIPRSHLTWIARVWEGTSGDRVITARDAANKGKAYAIIAPNWSTLAETNFTAEEQRVITEMVNTLADNGEQLPNESVTQFAARRSSCSSRSERTSGATVIPLKPACGMQSPLNFLGTLPNTGSF